MKCAGYGETTSTVRTYTVRNSTLDPFGIQLSEKERKGEAAFCAGRPASALMGDLMAFSHVAQQESHTMQGNREIRFS